MIFIVILYMLNNRCCALLKNKNRCSFKKNESSIFCTRHQNLPNVERYDKDLLDSNSLSLLNIYKLSHNADYNKQLLKYKKNQLVELLKLYNVDIKGNKDKLIQNIKEIVHYFSPYIKHNKSIIKIQRWTRLQFIKKIVRLRGPVEKNIRSSVNHCDFLTFESLEDIPYCYLYTYIDSDTNVNYFFDIRSIYNLLSSSKLNPYDRKPFSQKNINNARSLYKLLHLFNILETKYNPVDEQLTLEQQLKNEVIDIFLLIDNLDQYTNPNWFLDLNLRQLKKFYIELEDIWNYRLSLTKEVKRKIVPPNGKVFEIKPITLNTFQSKPKVMKECIKVMKLLITSSEDKCDRINGAIYILFSLVLVSSCAANALPIYYNMVGNNIEIHDNTLIMA